MVARRLAAAQGADRLVFWQGSVGDINLLSPHKPDDVLDRLHGFGGERLGATLSSDLRVCSAPNSNCGGNDLFPAWCSEVVLTIAKVEFVRQLRRQMIHFAKTYPV